MKVPLFALWPAFLGALIRKYGDVFGIARHSMCDAVYLEAEVGETVAAWARSPARNQLE